MGGAREPAAGLRRPQLSHADGAWQGAIATGHALGDLERLLRARPTFRIVVETCTEPFRIAAVARRHGHEVRIVAATLVRSLGAGERRLKNDLRDAGTLSGASGRMNLPSVHIPSANGEEV